MIDRRAFVASVAGLGLAVRFGGDKAVAAASHVQSVTALTQVFGDGLKLSAVAVQFDTDIAGTSLSPATFSVADRTVTRAYTNASARIAETGVDGPFVIVELALDDEAAALWSTGDGAATSGSPGAAAATTPVAAASPPAGVGPGGPTAGEAGPGGMIKAAHAALIQVGPVTTAGGVTYPASSTTLLTTAVMHPIVDGFTQLTYTDAATGQTLQCNLFLPQPYDPEMAYPLVLFMHDASVVGAPTQAPLAQGLGAVCWASPQDQAKRQAFVLAPEYPTVVVDDTYEPSALFDATVNLVRWLPTQYAIDTNRLYATGQSMGAMMTLGMNIRHPDLFAASFVVAGQWPAEQAAPLAGTKLWIVVSEDDDKASAGENAIMAQVEGAGATVSRAVWDAQATPAQFAVEVERMAAEGASINYVAFRSGTVAPASSGGGGSAHMATWRIAYTIDGIRDWIFQQSR